MNMRLVHAGLMTVASIAALAAYEGLTATVGAHDWWLKGFCAVIAFGIGTGTFLVWHCAYAVAPALPEFKHRLQGWMTTLAGCVFILAFSAWFSAVALGGNEAMRAGYERVVGQAQTAMAQLSSDGGLGSLYAVAKGISDETERLIECEFQAGCVSGGKGTGGVHSTLQNLAKNVSGKLTAIAEARQAQEKAYAEGTACVEKMRAAVSATSDPDARREALACGAACVNKSIGILAENRIADELRANIVTIADIVIPASIKTDRQRQAVENILAAARSKASAIAKGSDNGGSGKVAPLMMPELNAMQAVITNWQAIVPAWAAAIALDLLPLILMSFIATAAAARREAPDDAVLAWTVRDLQAASRFLKSAEAPNVAITLRRNPASALTTPSYGPGEER